MAQTATLIDVALFGLVLVDLQENNNGFVVEDVLRLWLMFENQLFDLAVEHIEERC